MILITGANGQTGRAIIKALLSKGERIRAFVHTTEQIQEIKSLGQMEVVAGDMLDQKAVNEAFIGVSTVYHICPAVNPHEVEIGQMIIKAARLANVEHFVYHSVLHSVLQDMPHHQKKLMVEELLVDSGIPYTIIQPAVFMQNILMSWKLLSEKGIFQQKFFTTQETRICMIDLEDLAEAASIILTSPGHIGATYELCGPENLSLSDMKAAMEQHFGHKIKVETPQDAMFAAQLKNLGVGDYQVNTLLKMFQHYNEHGFIGNPNVLTWILGRKPNNFSSFILRALKNKI
ncbi:MULTISPECIES: SDR family oxidoreductase [Priestia]|uniref:SDR family oxidoreductase n=1 Tax=Priestia TaxID=2800373 RepID=UPI0006FB56E9|nr:NmrA family NAD(P)-binding protein [Priestia megaterium]KQU25065.1 nucleoside-diphosphate sugar epimerase [Bacillus sp. Leaf75]MED4761417.1 NmrA family NAD(P)-binding protein [Priestia megaterium]QLK07313.1 putative nucleoside-diphosphate-sugar epimerase [Priestia megaterium]USL38025.1 NmrA family NAD(P)-binding protein [Priestia megaterium]